MADGGRMYEERNAPQRTVSGDKHLERAADAQSTMAVGESAQEAQTECGTMQTAIPFLDCSSRLMWLRAFRRLVVPCLSNGHRSKDSPVATGDSVRGISALVMEEGVVG
jgi:hypothetical protein